MKQLKGKRGKFSTEIPIFCVCLATILAQICAGTGTMASFLVPIMTILCYLVLSQIESVIGLVYAVIASSGFFFAIFLGSHKLQWRLIGKKETFFWLFFCWVVLIVAYIIGKILRLMKKDTEKLNLKDKEELHPYISLEEAISPSSDLLVQAKEKAPKLFEHLKQTSELARMAALEIKAEEKLAQAGGWYHEIGRLTTNQKEETISEGIRLAKEHHLPPELIELLKQQDLKHSKPASKEAAIVLLADTFLSSIAYLYSNEKTGWTMEMVIEQTFRIRLEKGSLDESNLMVGEFLTIKHLFMEQFAKEDKENDNTN